MPSLFISHTSPMLAFDTESARDYKHWGERLPKPKALLVFSAHWEEAGLVFGETIRHKKLVYDFFGFPNKLYQLQYPAPGAEWLIDDVRQTVNEDIPLSNRGLDHGVWIPLLYMWPDADVPILQMSLPSNYSNQQFYELGRQLASLRRQGIMIAGGGTLSHNLKESFSRRHTETPEWAISFDHWIVQTLASDKEQLFDWENNVPNSLQNHPTPEHFRPLLITVGAANNLEIASYPLSGFDTAVFSKRSVQIWMMDCFCFNMNKNQSVHLDATDQP